MSTATDRPTPARNSLPRDAWVNFKRWSRKAVRNPTAFFLEIVVGVFSLLLFSAVFGDVGEFALAQAGYADVDYLTYLVPAVFMQATMGSAFTSGVGLVGDLESGMFEKVTATPMGWTAVLLGKAAADLLRILVQLLVVLALAVALGASVETGVAGVVGIAAVSLLVGLLFMSVANILGVLVRDEEAINAASMLFMFPLLFLSPAFIPVASDIEWLARLNPVTYGVDAIRALVLGEDVLTVLEVSRFGGIYDTLVPAVAVLVGLNVVFGAIAVWVLGRASSVDAA
ncbi:ABC transporter permease [Haloarcula sp. S1CR25-12]|uniref:ABC transporter permease n=1 Tax=Haloarcula saliterrae TaxID=2950534 RepID=A0ABU2FDB8_9EURY|nr:ABC transporter permease [Haloarcula sp. S1CR25-12]MDS0260267.1 ABC transporter permease [Haloarcula sp. S1CR25-12]